MKKILYLFICLFLIVFMVPGCSGKNDNDNIFTSNNVSYTAKAEIDGLNIYRNGTWKEFIVKGVTIEPTYPGRQRFDISQAEYLDWFKQIEKMNANTIRVNEIFSPEFYDALLHHNKRNSSPLYLLQGIKPDNNMLKEIPDTFRLDNIAPFKDEMVRAVDVIHGKSNIHERDKFAYGKYKSDISQYVLGFVIGTEWEPEMVDNVNKVRLDKGDFNGDFVYTEEGNPFEHYLAAMMDHILSYEMDTYGWQHPVSFVNYSTTDMLNQSFEPVKEEDMVSINPNVIKLKNDYTGQFASYHIYPYYPEFLNLDPKYNMYIDHRGKTNSFAGYLKDLISVHRMPVLVAEFGLPSSRGLEQVSVHGLNKGFLSEKQQGEYLSMMYEDIIYQGALGGVVNSWQDNWTKWSNAQNADENFGLLSFDRNKIKIDGNVKDWKSNKNTPLFSTDKKDDHPIKKVYIDQDERYLYFAIEYKNLKTDPMDTIILLDTIPYQGNKTNPYNSMVTKSGTDYIINIKNNGQSKLLVDSYYDIHYFQHSKYLPEGDLDFSKKENEIYTPIMSVIREQLVSFKTGQKIPFMDYETGILKEGNGNPTANDFDSLADYYINRDKNLMELRVPWSLLGFKDPSKKIIQNDFHVNGLDSILIINDIKINISAYSPEEADSYYILPEITYTLEDWDMPQTQERLKESYSILKDTFKNY